MDKHSATRVLINYGLSNFYDVIPDISVEEILSRIEMYIFDSQPKGFYLWEKDIIAISVALKCCTDEELDNILEQNYAIYAHKVGGGRKFFQRLHDVMAAALNHKKSQTDQ